MLRDFGGRAADCVGIAGEACERVAVVREWPVCCFSRKWSLPPIRIGYLPIYVDLPFFVAMEQDYFSKRELVVEPVCFASSPEIGTALLTGDVHFGGLLPKS